MKHRAKRIVAAILACLAAGLLPSNTLAEQSENTPKEEVVYVSLEADGSFGRAYVVNAFDLSKPGTIVDYGDYSTVANLSTTDPLDFEDGRVRANAPAGRFYYQGDLDSARLPWLISVTYLLNGKPVEAASLAGAKGRLQIRLAIRDNPGAEKTFAGHYALQVSVALDTQRCAGILAGGATIANSGKHKVVSFIKMPDTDADYSITADVEAFEMEGIQIAGIPLTVDMSLPDTGQLTGGFAQLRNGIRDLHGGAGELNEGAAGLADGAGQLCDGLRSMQTGLGDVEGGLSELVGGNGGLLDGSKQIKDALNEIRTQLNGFSVTTSDLTRLAEGSAQIAQGIGELSGGLDALGAGFSRADGGVSALTGGAFSGLHEANEATVAALNDRIAVLMADGHADPAEVALLTQAAGLLTANDELVSGLKTGIAGDGTGENPGLAAGAAALDAQYAQFDAGVQELPSRLGDMAAGITRLKEGIDALAGNYGEFHSGLKDYARGAASIHGGLKELCKGFNELAKGGADLSAGLKTLLEGTLRLKDGTGELRSRTQNMDAEMQARIEEMLETYTQTDFDVVSFVSPLNTNVESVQFVMVTDGIAAAQDAEEPAQKESDGPKDFWGRLLALFGL